MRKLIYLIFTLTLAFSMSMIGCNDYTNIQGPDISEKPETTAMQNPAFLSGSYDLNSFTQEELDDNWEADRYFPTGGVASVTAFGRDNVARLSIDSESTQPGTFQRTEGIKTVGDRDFGTVIEIDLYLDPAWENNATRAGLWLAGNDGLGNRDNQFGILEFVNLEPSTSSESAQADHEGWRIWDSAVGWSNLSTDFTYSEWVTLGIELNTNAQQYIYYINGEEVGKASGGENFIRELFLNSYNYGEDEFPNLGNNSYTANWHVGANNPQTKADCKKGGWRDYNFKNQGQCIRSVNTGKDSR